MFRPLLLGASALCISSGISSAALVLTIDISNPSSTIITAVANNSQITKDLAVNFLGGISFVAFFDAIEDITVDDALQITGNWTARGTTSAYSEMVTFNYGNFQVVPGRDLSIYNLNASGSDDQNFLNTAAPFTGSSTVDFSSFASLPAAGTTGDVYSGYQGSHGGVIGQWVVIPEPSSLLIAATGLVGLMRRRR